MDPMKTAARVLGLVLATVVTFIASSSAALADTPVGDAWPKGEGRSKLDTLLVFGGITVALFVVIWLLALLTARNNYVPPAPSTELEPVGDNRPAAHH
jgi:hypothetical protein